MLARRLAELSDECLAEKVRRRLTHFAERPWLIPLSFVAFIAFTLTTIDKGTFPNDFLFFFGVALLADSIRQTYNGCLLREYLKRHRIDLTAVVHSGGECPFEDSHSFPWWLWLMATVLFAIFSLLALAVITSYPGDGMGAAAMRLLLFCLLLWAARFCFVRYQSRRG